MLWLFTFNSLVSCKKVLHVLNKDHSSDNIEEEMRKGVGGCGDDDDEIFVHKFDNKRRAYMRMGRRPFCAINTETETTTFKHAPDILFENRHLSKL